jgi:hypothetical protein
MMPTLLSVGVRGAMGVESGEDDREGELEETDYEVDEAQGTPWEASGICFHNKCTHHVLHLAS